MVKEGKRNPSFSRGFCLSLFFPPFFREKREKKTKTLFFLSFFSNGQVSRLSAVLLVQRGRESSQAHPTTIHRSRTLLPRAPRGQKGLQVVSGVHLGTHQGGQYRPLTIFPTLQRLTGERGRFSGCLEEKPTVGKMANRRSAPESESKELEEITK